MGENWLERTTWQWACAECDPNEHRPQVELLVFERDALGEVVEVKCAAAGHTFTCIYCGRSSKFRLTPGPLHVEASCVECRRFIKNVRRSARQHRPKAFQPDDVLKQAVYERDRTCRFCNFDVVGMIADAVTDPSAVPSLASLDKVVQRLIAERARSYQNAAPTLFDLPSFVSATDDDVLAVFYDLTDPYAQAAALHGQRMLQYDHLLGVQFVKPLWHLLDSQAREFLGKECVVLSCNICNDRRKHALEDEPRLLELYVRIFLGRYKRIPKDEYEKFRIFARAARMAHEHLERAKHETA